MRVAKRYLSTVILIFLVNFSFAQQKIVLGEVDVFGDTIASAPVYVNQEVRKVDVLHMNLEIAPNFNTHSIFGHADVYVKPFATALDTICLDAKSMQFTQVARVNGNQNIPLKFTNNGQKVCVVLDTTLATDQVICLQFGYIAHPDSIQAKGGTAITEAKGFYFIDATENYPASFWTQGEPESNSAWFPTNDKPNEKFTHQIGITLDTAWQSLSNGFLAFRTENEDGTKTDYWKMDQPHAPYLTMVAGGPFDTVFTEWNGKPVRYFVEKQWKQNARQIFEETHEMLTYFGELFDLPFPWQKYDQIVVRNYVSGAMENTTATVHGTSVYRDARALADKTAEDVIAHEIVHQWFGDLVTCKSWSYIPLNEGIASYGEVLWHEHKYGKDDMAWYMRSELKSYLNEFNRGEIHPIIRFDYESPEQQFNNHSYAKTGLVLHMLRNLVGDVLFFKSLHNYLVTNKYEAVELANLRMAFEKTTGRDLRWFFDQWFMQPGHPQLEITPGYNAEKGVATLEVKQIQDLTTMPVYRLPVNVKVLTRQGEKIYPINVTKQQQTFEFPAEQRPRWVKFDVENQLLAEIKINQIDAAWLGQLGNSNQGIDRYNALEVLLKTSSKNLQSTAAGIAMMDDFWPARLAGLNSSDTWDARAKQKLESRVERLLTDSVNAVRAKAIAVWSDVFNKQADTLFNKNLEYNSYVVNSAALQALAKNNPVQAVKKARMGVDSTNDFWALKCTQIIVNFGTEQDIEFANSVLEKQSPRKRLKFYALLANSMVRTGKPAKKAVIILTGVAAYDSNEYLKYYAYKLLEQGTETVEEMQNDTDNTMAKELAKTAKFARKKLHEIPEPN